MTPNSMRRPAQLLATLLALLATATTTRAQGQPARATVVPHSDLIPMSLLWGAESGDGRFYIASDALTDTIKRYDRVTRRWETVTGIKIGRANTWSPNGRFIAFARTPDGMSQTHIWIQPMDSATGRPNGMARRVSSIPGDWPAWSPDSRRISFSSNTAGRFRIAVIPFNGGDAEILFDGVGHGRSAWSPDGKYLFGGLGGERQPITSIRVSLATKRVDTLPPQSVGFFGYSPDGSRLGFYDFFSRTLTVASSDGRLLQHVKVPGTGWIRFPSWSRSTPGEITGLQDVARSNLFAVSLPGGQLRALGPVESAGFGGFAFSPDGRRLTYTRSVDGITQLFVANADGSGARSLGQPGDVLDHEWSPTGNQVAYVFGSANQGPSRVFVANADGSKEQPLGQSGEIGSIVWSPTGAHIAYLLGSTIRLVEPTKGNDRVLVPENGIGRATSIRWRSDGQALRYLWHPRGTQVPEREVREVTLGGGSRVLAQLPASRSTSFVGDSLVLVLQGNGVDIVNLRTGDLKRIYTGNTRGDNSGVGVSNDGEWIVFEGHEGSTRFPVMVSLKTGESRRIPNPLGGQSFAIRFHPDGRNLVVEYCVTCANDIERWDVALIPMNGDPTRVLTSSLRNYKSFTFPAISPDGSTLIFQGDESWNTRVVSMRLPGSR